MFCLVGWLVVYKRALFVEALEELLRLGSAKDQLVLVCPVFDVASKSI